ncbi:MAG: ATP-binding cassette domain-containing protein [Clostridia bacterium]
MSIEINNLSFKYDDAKVLADVNIVIPSHSFVLLAGVYGSAKSTLLKCISGLEKYEGEIICDDVVLDNTKPLLNRNFSYLPSKPLLLRHKSVKQNLYYQLKVCGINKENYIKKVNSLQLFYDINSIMNKRVSKLNLFEKQVLCFLRSIIKSPKLIMIDTLDGLSDNEKEQYLKIVISYFYTSDVSIIYTEEIKTANSINFTLKLYIESGILVKFNEKDFLYDNIDTLYKAIFTGDYVLFSVMVDGEKYIIASTNNCAKFEESYLTYKELLLAVSKNPKSIIFDSLTFERI